MANWITLADAVAFLKMTGTPPANLQGFIDSACSQVEDIKGHIGQETIMAEIAGTRTSRYGQRVELEEYPLLSVGMVERLNGDGTVTALTPYDPVAGTAGYQVRNSMLFVDQSGNYRVTYDVGLNPVPPDWTEATLELVSHHYRASQINEGSGGRSGGTEDDVLLLSRTMITALPYRVRELLGIYGSAIRSRVWIR